jgi:hypothetical protein
MTDHIIDGRATGRQQLLHMLRDACAGATALCEQSAIASGHWRERAETAIKACGQLQRGLIQSHPQLADQLHILATEIQIGLAAQSDEPVFAMRIERIRGAVRTLQRMGAEI